MTLILQITISSKSAGHSEHWMLEAGPRLEWEHISGSTVPLALLVIHLADLSRWNRR